MLRIQARIRREKKDKLQFTEDFVFTGFYFSRDFIHTIQLTNNNVKNQIINENAPHLNKVMSKHKSNDQKTIFLF